MEKKMTEDEFKDKLQEYINRNNIWTDRAITQLGYSINLFTTIGIALLGYIFAIKDKFQHLNFTYGEFSFSLPLDVITIISIIFSIGFGFMSVLSRLLDFRISRHLALSRKRFLIKNKDEVFKTDRAKGLIDSKIIDISDERKCPTFIKYIFGKGEFINESDFNELKVVDKFDVLRKESAILGDLTWSFHKCQIGFFLLSIIIYGLMILI